jgi:hypothetical protein
MENKPTTPGSTHIERSLSNHPQCCERPGPVRYPGSISSGLAPSKKSPCIQAAERVNCGIGCSTTNHLKETPYAYAMAINPLPQMPSTSRLP